MLNDLSIYQKVLEQKIGQNDYLLKEKEKEKNVLLQYKRESRNIEDAQIILQKVAQQTQDEIKLYISNLISLALATIYDDPYEFELEFKEKRGRTEAIPYFIRDKEIFIPGKETGCGPVDIASFALRLSLWNLNKHTISSTIILDEPFKNLDGKALPKVTNLLNYLVNKLDLQFIIITHNEDLTLAANKLFRIEKK